MAAGLSCELPFAHPLSQARRSYLWPDVLSICSYDTVIVDEDAYVYRYGRSCSRYCKEGPGHKLDPSHSNFWIKRDPSDRWQSCPGEYRYRFYGYVCRCTFPDRRL